MDFTALAATIVAFISPFAPFLVKLTRTSAEEFAKVVATHGGEVAWENAKNMWDKLTAHFGNDPEATQVANLVAIKPEEKTYQTMLAALLAKRLEENPGLAQDIMAMLGGQEAIQRMIGGQGAWLVEVRQTMLNMGGTQHMEVGDHGVIYKGEQKIG